MSSILSKIGVDKAIKYVLLGRGFTVLSGILILYLVSTQLTPEQQGVYYTFSSLVSLQVIFELGLSTVLIQFFSHEMEGIEYSLIHKKFVGKTRNKERVNSLIRMAVKWYIAIGLIVIFVIGPIGYFFFINEVAINIWFSAWVTLVVFTAVNIMFISVTSLCEGCGFVARINKLRFFQSILAGVISVLFLLSNNGLFSVSAMAISGTIVFGTFWYRDMRKVISSAFSARAKNIISWRKEILPMQWRIALSWLSGYFIFFIINPIAFKAFGAGFAGQLGITMSVCNMVMNIGLAWLTTKSPYWGVLIAKQDRTTLDRSFKLAFKQSLIFVCFSLISGCILLKLLEFFGFAIVQRFLHFQLFSAIAIAIIGNHIIGSLATYIRAHKVEKMTAPSALMAVLTVLVLTIFSYYKQDDFFVISYTLIVWGYFVPITYVIYKRFKNSYER